MKYYSTLVVGRLTMSGKCLRLQGMWDNHDNEINSYTAVSSCKSLEHDAKSHGEVG